MGACPIQRCDLGSRATPIVMIGRLRSLVVGTLVIFFLGGLLLSRAGASSGEDAVLRVHVLLNLIGEEYRESIQGESIIRDREYEEARSFTDEARRRWAAIDDGPRGEELFAALVVALNDHAKLPVVNSLVDTLHVHIEAKTGVSANVFPPRAPSLAQGKLLYEPNCASCHGERGDGR